MRSRLGQEPTFLSTFGMHLDITMASLRIEYLIPTGPQTRQSMTQAFEQWLGEQGSGCRTSDLHQPLTTGSNRPEADVG
ncbi:hypothetical protein [Pseudomonas sp. S2_H01]